MTVVISDGPASHTLEALAGRTADEVRTILTTAGVNIGDDEEYFSSDVAEGSVLNVRITPRDGGDPYACGDGCEVFEDDSAVVQVSLGEVPEVSGLTVSQATEALTAKGLDVNSERTEQFSDDFAEGQVIAIADRGE